MIRRVGSVVAVATLAMTSLAACSGGEDEAYCAKLEDASEAIDANVDSSDFAAVQQQVDTMKGQIGQIRELAPEEVEQQWASLAESIDAVRPSLRALGGVDDIEKLSRQEQVELMHKVDLTKIDEFNKTIDEAGDAIDKDGRERCGLDLQ